MPKKKQTKSSTRKPPRKKAAAPREQQAKGGRPSSYRPEFVEQARFLCSLGATDEELARFFKVATRTLYRWKAQFPEFCQAIKIGGAPADERVERSLYARAVGYTFDAVKIMQHQGVPITVKYKEHVPPDVGAMCFWLKNRQPEKWREISRQEVTGKDGTPLMPEASPRDVARAVLDILRTAEINPAT